MGQRGEGEQQRIAGQKGQHDQTGLAEDHDPNQREPPDLVLRQQGLQRLLVGEPVEWAEIHLVDSREEWPAMGDGIDVANAGPGAGSQPAVA